MERIRFRVSQKLLICLLLWWTHNVDGRPWESFNDEEPRGHGGSSASVFINTGQAGPGGVHIVVYSFGGKLAYVLEDAATATTATPNTSEVSIETHQVIIAPPIPRECPNGEKPDANNECREEWFVDFGRSFKPKPGSDQQQLSTPGVTVTTTEWNFKPKDQQRPSTPRVTMTTTERNFKSKQGLGQQQLTTSDVILKTAVQSFKSKPGLETQQLTTPNVIVKTTERNFKPKRGLDQQQRPTPGVTVATTDRNYKPKRGLDQQLRSTPEVTVTTTARDAAQASHKLRD